MAVTVLSFRAQYPEFRGITDGAVTAALSDAAVAIDPVVWGVLYDRGVGLKCAALLSLSPNGAAARLATDPTQSTYQVEFDRLVDIVGLGLRVFL